MIRVLIRRKFIFVFIVLGSCGGLYVGIMNFLSPEIGLGWFFMNFLVFLVLGIALGSIAFVFHYTGRKLLLQYDKNGDLLLVRQKIYLITPLVMCIAYWLNLNLGSQGQLTIALFNGGIFIIGLSCGIFSQFTDSAKRYLVLGLIPLSISLIYIFVSDKQSVVFIVWLLAIMYLLSSLIMLNCIQLNRKLFNSKDININNSTKIKWTNYVLVIIFTSLCVIAIFIRDVLSFITNVAKKISLWLFNVLIKITDWFTRDNFKNKTEPLVNFEEMAKEPISLLANVILLILCVLFLVLTIVFIIVGINLVRGSKKFRVKKLHSETNEFYEDTEIVKTTIDILVKEKYLYTTKGLSKQKNMGERIRYLYGFILERFYKKQYPIQTSHTPSEIYDIARNHKNGKRLDEIGFKELTDIYRKVRYGDESVILEGNFVNLARKYEKSITNIGFEEDGRNIT